MILDIDKDPICGNIRIQPHFRVAPRELERVLQQIAYCRGEHLGIRVDQDIFVDRRHREFAFVRPRIKRRGGFGFIQDLSKANGLQARRQVRGDPHFSQRAIDEMTHCHQTAIEYRARRPCNADVTPFDGFDGESRRMEVVSKFVGQRPQPRFYRLKAVFCRHHGLLRRKFGNGARNGGVEAAVKGTKFRNFNWCAGLKSEIHNGLANIAIVPDYLLEGKALIEEIAPVQSRHFTDFGKGRANRRTGHSLAYQRLRCLFKGQRLDELIEKSGDSVRQLVIGCLGSDLPATKTRHRSIKTVRFALRKWCNTSYLMFRGIRCLCGRIHWKAVPHGRRSRGILRSILRPPFARSMSM